MNRPLSIGEVIAQDLYSQLAVATLKSKRNMLQDLLKTIKSESHKFSNWRIASQLSIMDLGKLSELKINQDALSQLKNCSNDPEAINKESIIQIQESARLLIGELSIKIEKLEPVAELEKID